MDLNTANLVKRANARMELLRKAVGFGASTEDLKSIHILFIRSILEQSATVWHSSLSQENINDLERVQKSATKIILKNRFQGYQNALIRLELKTLSEKREELCLNFAIKCTNNSKLSSMLSDESPENSEISLILESDTLTAAPHSVGGESIKCISGCILPPDWSAICCCRFFSN